jgi:hypothetical protein
MQPPEIPDITQVVGSQAIELPSRTLRPFSDSELSRGPEPIMETSPCVSSYSKQCVVGDVMGELAELCRGLVTDKPPWRLSRAIMLGKPWAARSSI